jgi:transcriptional regulator with XRE-family HTH domain
MNATKSSTAVSGQLAALLSEAAASEDFEFELKAQEVAVNLAALMSHAGVKRADLARRLDWKAGRLSKVLSGEENLTLRTLHLVYKALGYTFDILPRTAAERVPMQPWQRFSFDNAHVVSADFTLDSQPTVVPQGGNTDDARPEWLSRSRKKSYQLDFKAANTDQYDAALAS